MEFQIGDVVSVAEYRSNPGMNGSTWLEPSIARVVILSVGKKYQWQRNNEYATVREIQAPSDEYAHSNTRWGVSLEHVSLVAKGSGSVTPGVDYEFTPEELRQQRFEAYKAKLAAVDQSHEGWTNAATWMAHLYLTQESAFHGWLKQNRRKDGTVNVNKLRKLFSQSGIKLDAWVLEAPIDPPAEFVGYAHPYMPRVNWEELAADLAELHEEN